MVSCIILAGGRSSRIKGMYKAVLPLVDKPLIKWIIESLWSVIDEFIVVVHDKNQRSKLSRYLQDVVIIEDDNYFNFDSPLIGALTGAVKARKNIIFITCCDQPFITPNIVSKIVDRCKNFEACVPKWPNGFLEPLTAAYKRREYIDAVRKSLEKGELKCTAPLKHLKTLFLDVYELTQSPEITFYNINTLEDYRNAEKIAERMYREFK
ncbi:MAG: hypothetical protein DRJ38_06860 [Thermoprotei archaeon]|nr:MAG: hypothetical protein DRJ38_06860 [Thermoprotei archaeon]